MYIYCLYTRPAVCIASFLTNNTFELQLTTNYFPYRKTKLAIRYSKIVPNLVHGLTVFIITR